MGEFNYGGVNPDKLIAITTKYDIEIAKGRGVRLTREQKIELGEEIRRNLETGVLTTAKSFFLHLQSHAMEQECVELAEAYINLKGRVTSTHPELITAEEPTESNLILEHLQALDGVFRFEYEPLGSHLLDDEQQVADVEELKRLMFSAIGPGDGEEQADPPAVAEDVESETTTVQSRVMTIGAHRRPIERVIAEVTEVDPDTKKKVMLSLFQLNTIPDSPDEKVRINGLTLYPEVMTHILKWNHTLKQEFLLLHLPLDQVMKISAQARKYPIVKAAVEEIRKNFEKWDDVIIRDITAAFDDLNRKLETQIKNLVSLSHIISDIIQSPEDDRALTTLTLLQLVPLKRRSGGTVNVYFRRVVDLFIQGVRDLTQQKANDLVKGALRHNIEFLKTELPKLPTTEELAQRRAKAPVSTKAIQLQAELHHAIRRGKIWAAGQPIVSGQGVSANQVFKLYHPSIYIGEKHSDFEVKPLVPAAFFKVGAGGEEAVGIMEKMMWDIAVVMGLEEQFVPTGQTVVKDASQFDGGVEQAMRWTSDGELAKIKGAKKTPRGGIQVAQNGVDLHTYLSNPGVSTALLSKSEIIKGTLASVVFGMFDAHAKNIFVTEEGKIKYFDNTRSLPNSNGFIHRGDSVVSSYRCSLLCLPDAREALSSDEVNQLKKDVSEYKIRISKLKKYLQSPYAQSQLRKLPPGWMDTKSSIAALEERVNLIEAALNEGKVTDLQQLAIVSNPTYKFAFAVTYLYLLVTGGVSTDVLADKIQTRLHGYIGFLSSKDQINVIKLLGYDVAEIKKWCDDSSLTLEDIINRVRLHHQDRVENSPEVQVIIERQQASEVILEEVLESAAADYKDWPRKECEQYALRINEDVFKKLDVFSIRFLYQATVEDAILSAGNNQNDFALAKLGYDFFVIYKTLTGYRVKAVDLKCDPGKVIVDGEEVEIAKLVESLKENSVAPTLDELSVIPEKSIGELLSAKPPGTVQMSKSPDNKNICVAYIDGNGELVEDVYFPGTEEGKYILLEEGEEYTLSEIHYWYAEGRQLLS